MTRAFGHVKKDVAHEEADQRLRQREIGLHRIAEALYKRMVELTGGEL